MFIDNTSEGQVPLYDMVFAYSKRLVHILLDNVVQ